MYLVVCAEGYCWSRTSERQVLRIRYMYLEAILKQEVGFFDSKEATTSEIIDSISNDTSLIQEVLSEKVLFIVPIYKVKRIIIKAFKWCLFEVLIHHVCKKWRLLARKRWYQIFVGKKYQDC
jgi:ABC-type multidrug transport system fused ATPase/permease subunit